MNKRTFLKTSSALVAGSVITQLSACRDADARTNWAGNLTYSTDNLHNPATIKEVQKVVNTQQYLRVLGSRHSFNAIADSDENQVSSAGLNKILALDKADATVTVEGGIKYGDLCKYLDDNGFALFNLASLPHISVAGACATATHGSGLNNGNLATSVTGIEFIDGRGNVVNLSKETDEAFNGAIVNLGALGVVTKLTLQLQPSFSMKQLVYKNLPMAVLGKDFETIMASGYSVSLFTDWRNKNINQVWIKSRCEAHEDVKIEPEFYGARASVKNIHPLEDLSAENCTEQMGVKGPWYERMPHFRMGFTPSSGKELQAEYFVPLQYGYEAMMAIEKLHEQLTPHLFISEIRTMAADNLWLSPGYNQACAIFHFTWKQEIEAVMGLLPLIEQQLAPFNARPHWGKLFTLSPEVLQSRIARLADFKKLMAHYDPDEKFRNEFINQNLFGA
ncbi:FAD-binding protein [Emticicia sp. 21SJ11W-3]|uniref:FAD-binding protein n=1 Tax=Emticicia sp. 21SJ11W-3 TaxID=2916755 RepID=UPI00209DFC0F|nr:FAD-binding protein [Emticicia sp. 21SJ11W-3]UTA69394.1 FAD-binding protein [Emticicia sp. 21SJ11W-3]